MKRFHILILLTIVLMGCSTQRGVVKFQPLSSELPQSISKSVPFMMFWNDFVNEVNAQERLEGFKTPEAMISKYNLLKEGECVRLNGVIEVDSTFNVQDSNEFDCRLLQMTPTQYTYSVPLSNLPAMLQLPGITAVDISHRVYVRPR